MNEPTLLLICGASGSGKTTLLQTIIRESPETRIGLLPAGTTPDWTALDVAALDEDWTPSDVAVLESEARKMGKRILAVVQNPEDLPIVSEPAVFRIEGAHSRAIFSYKGHELTFP